MVDASGPSTPARLLAAHTLRAPRPVSRQRAAPQLFAPGGGRAATSTLSAYLRDVSPVPVFTLDEEIHAAEAIHSHAAALRESLFDIPFTARWVVGRWKDLRCARRVTATLCAAARDPRHEDPNARIRQIEASALRKLRRRLGAQHGPDADGMEGSPCLG